MRQANLSSRPSGSPAYVSCAADAATQCDPAHMYQTKCISRSPKAWQRPNGLVSFPLFRAKYMRVGELSIGKKKKKTVCAQAC